MFLFESFLVALSTYSIIPVPQFEWNEKNMKYSICFFPAVGVLCGVLLYLWDQCCQKLGIESFFFALIATVIPVLITGGIHLDGYMDTVDALSSHQSQERKLEILKDPHCGAFSVIYCIVYFLLNVGFLSELYQANSIFLVCPLFVFSRVLSVLCAVNLPNARKRGMLYRYTENVKRKNATVFMIILAVLCSFFMISISGVVGGIAVCFGVGTVFYYFKMTKKQFGGVTGDTAGFFLQICELACLTGIWIGALLQ